MRQVDAILQEVWRIKDAAYKRAGNNSQLFAAQLLERSAQLRVGLDLKEIHTPPVAEITAVAINACLSMSGMTSITRTAPCRCATPLTLAKF